MKERRSESSRLKILQIHNSYQQPGGEDRVVEQELDLLRSHGHEVIQLTASNDGIRGISDRFRTALRSAYSPEAKARCAEALDVARPDIVHVHNLFPLLSPSVLDACAERAVPVVMTLHNYRLLCPGALLMRGGHVCTRCVAGTPYAAVIHRCYRGSFLGSAVASHVVAAHRARGTWRIGVHRFIALTEFARNLFIQGGLPTDRIVVKPNFCSPGPASADGHRSGALFVGRLSREKGVATLLSAWKSIPNGLSLAGSGPYAAEENLGPHVTFLGALDSETVAREMRKAQFLVMPSECFEGFGMVIVEAFAAGSPVLASRLGAMAEIVKDGVTGLHFEAGNPRDLAAKARWLFEHPDQCRRMGLNARAEYERKYTPERNYEMLMDIYEQAIDEAHRQYGDS